MLRLRSQSWTDYCQYDWLPGPGMGDSRPFLSENYPQKPRVFTTVPVEENIFFFTVKQFCCTGDVTHFSWWTWWNSCLLSELHDEPREPTPFLKLNHLLTCSSRFKGRKFIIKGLFFIFRITYIFLPFQSKWFYVGTEKGNIHVVNIENFALSGYVINWNKAIEV